MAFNIDAAIAEIKTKGVLRNNKFLVRMPIPQALSGSISNLGDFTAIQGKLEFWCEGANLPGAALSSGEIRRFGYGVAEKKPFSTLMTEVNLTFRMDAKGLIHAYFHNWMRCAVTYENGPGALTTLAIGPIKNQGLWEVGYKDDYKVQVDIIAFDDAGNRAIQVTLRDAYPLFVGDVPLNWASRGEYAHLPVSLTYFDWYTHGINAVNTGNLSG